MLAPAVSEPPVRIDPKVRARGLVVDEVRRASGMRHVSVPVLVPGGLEAASWTSTSTPVLDVWRLNRHGRDLHLIGRARYPANPYFRQGCSPIVTGRDLKGSPDATFILHQCLTGDGSLNAVAVGNGPEGWGLLRMVTAHRYASTGTSTAHADTERWDVEFDHGQLATIDGSDGYFSEAGANLFPRVRLWSWRHQGFTATGDSGFIARPATAPHLSAPGLPAAGCPKSGTYRASFGVSYGRRDTAVANTPLTLLVFPVSTRYPLSVPCRQTVQSSLPLTVLAAHTSKPLLATDYGKLIGRRWITAPVWMLVSAGTGLGSPSPMFREDVGEDSPYQVPPSLRVNVMLTDFYDSNIRGFGGYTSRDGHPPSGTVTFDHSRITSLAIAQ